MKKFSAVEATRKAYHHDATRDSVHRSSLLVPEMDGAEAEISFVNHFRLKRGFDKVACRITGVAPDGAKIESRLVPVTEPRVYTLALTGLFDRPCATYLVEFFAADNLTIPFPAVMINHRGPGFINTVHAYNRVLNDVFEEDALAEVDQAEAAIDLHGDRFDSFVLFHAGPLACDGAVDIEVARGGARRSAQVEMSVPRLCHRELRFGRDLAGLDRAPDGVVRVRQPRQSLFYGRMLVGARAPDGAFSGNHSYYDCSETPEYWDNAEPSARVYPYIPALTNIVRFHPTIAPGAVEITVQPCGSDGAPLGEPARAVLESPDGPPVEIPVDPLVGDRDAVSAFEVIAQPVSGNTPTRIAHQLVHCHGNGLSASVVIGLINGNVFQPEGKRGLSWGQIPLGPELDSWLAVAPTRAQGPARDLTLTIYGAEGVVTERSLTIAAGAGRVFDLDGLLDGAPLDPDERNLWFMIHGPDPDIAAYTVTRHAETGHCTGEHSF